MPKIGKAGQVMGRVTGDYSLDRVLNAIMARYGVLVYARAVEGTPMLWELYLARKCSYHDAGKIADFVAGVELGIEVQIIASKYR